MQLADYLQLSLTFVAMVMRHTYCSVTIGMTPKTTVTSMTRLDYNAVSDVQVHDAHTAIAIELYLVVRFIIHTHTRSEYNAMSDV